MPHSILSDSQDPREAAKAELEMVDALAPNGHGQQTADDDVKMTGANGDEKSDVKLEDLFADVESDEEFPSSRQDEVKPSSPPVAPSSPVYGTPCLASTIETPGLPLTIETEGMGTV